MTPAIKIFGLLAVAASLTSCASTAPEPGDLAWQSGNGHSGGNPALLAIMDKEQAQRGQDQLLVEWVPYIDRTSRLAVQRAPVGFRIVTPGSTMTQAEADAWLPWEALR